MVHKDLAYLIEAETFTKELVNGGIEHWHNYKRQSTAGLINHKNKQQKMPDRNCAKYKQAALLQYGQASALLRLSSWLYLKDKFQEN